MAAGRIEGAGYGDVGKQIEVRIHADHASKPEIGSPIVLGALGLPIAGHAAGDLESYATPWLCESLRNQAAAFRARGRIPHQRDTEVESLEMVVGGEQDSECVLRPM